jgi:hypothetical protein
MCKNLRLPSLSTNGRPHTLKSLDFKAIICDYDIVFLQEIKHIYVFRMTGFQVLRSSIIKSEERRGGVAVLFLGRIWPFVYGTSTFQDQVWFSLSFAKNVCFGAIYIAPFLKPDSFGNIQEMSLDKEVILLGDFNARISNLGLVSDPSKKYSYSQNRDTSSNNHGNEMLNFCKNSNLFSVNHLKTGKRHDDFTYCKGTSWTSQIDWAFIVNL